MILQLLRFRLRPRSPLLLGALVLLVSGLMSRQWGGSEHGDPWGHSLYITLTSWALWCFLMRTIDVGWSLGSRSSALTQVLPVRARDLWVAALLAAWTELSLPALVVAAVAVVMSPELLTSAPAFLAHYMLAAAFFVLLYQSKDPQRAQVSSDWASRSLGAAGFMVLVVAAHLRSPLFTGALTVGGIGLALRTWSNLPQSFSRQQSAQPACSSPSSLLERLLRVDRGFGAEARFLLRMHRTELLVLLFFCLPLAGFAFPWVWEKLGFLALFLGALMAYPILSFLRAWRKLAHLPVSPRRFIALHTLPVWGLFAGGYGVGALVHNHMASVRMGSVEAALSLLLLALAYSFTLAVPLGRLRNKRPPEGAFTILGGTPLQLGSNLLLIVLMGAFIWLLMSDIERSVAVFREAIASVISTLPFGPVGAWALLALFSVGAWFFLERRFRSFDPGGGIRL